jgi:hypothetical protein
MNRFIILAVLGLSVASCKKSWLDVVPLGNLVAATTDDYDQLMNDNALYYFTAGGWAEAAEMGDELAGEGPYLNAVSSVQIPRGFQYQAVIYQQNDYGPFDLQFGLSGLYEVNKIISEVASSTGGSDTQKAELKAEAEATRAWIYWGFVNYYAKPYSAATAPADPGFPIISQAVATATNYTRGTVEGTYDFMIGDLTAAIAVLPVKAAQPTRMSRPAAEGLLGKIYLFMGKYAAADSQFTAALADIAAAGAPVLYNYNVTFAPGGSFLPIDPTFGPASPCNNYTDETESLVFKVFYSGPYNGNQWGNTGLVLAPWAQRLFGPTDWRLKLYSATNADGSANVGGRLRKYGQQYTRFGLELPDLYLMSAEARARLGDLGGAKTLVENLRQNRMPVADAAVPADTAASQAAMIHFIIDERVREFAFDGYRWFDMRRLSVDPLFSGITFIHTVFNDDATNSTTTYTLDQPNRLTLQLPPTIMNGNPNMVNNP